MLICLIGLTLFAQQVSLRGTWSATDGSRQLAGRWTARPGGEGGSVSGTWEVVSREGEVFLNGTWSLAKEPKAWRGSWAARLPDDRVLAGQWTATSKLDASAQFAELLKAAAAGAAGGTWRAGNRSGSWAIRTESP
jgi:hypothetical protein